MRAVRYWILLTLACGGRTLDDGSYDDGSGAAPGTGAVPGTGASSSGARGPTPVDPGPAGAAGVGGSSGAGGSFGGTPAGGTGNFANTGGMVGGSAGVGVVPECLDFCKSSAVACPGTDDFLACTQNCSVEAGLSDPACYEARVAALDCVARALRSFSNQCDLAQLRAGELCAEAIDRADRCGVDACPGSISQSRDSCSIYQFCPDGEYVATCTREVTGSYCECSQNGVMFASLFDDDLPIGEACADPSVIRFCQGR